MVKNSDVSDLNFLDRLQNVGLSNVRLSRVDCIKLRDNITTLLNFILINTNETLTENIINKQMLINEEHIKVRVCLIFRQKPLINRQRTPVFTEFQTTAFFLNFFS